MAGEPGYRFLPWTRRGLAGGITQPDASGVPARATVSVGITVTGAGDAGATLKLLGPGDIVGDMKPRIDMKEKYSIIASNGVIDLKL